MPTERRVSSRKGVYFKMIYLNKILYNLINCQLFNKLTTPAVPFTNASLGNLDVI